MTPKQSKQYKQFAAEAEVRIDEYNLTATGILAEYSRLKFFAAAYCDVEGRIVSCKRCQGSGAMPNGLCDSCGGTGEVEKAEAQADLRLGQAAVPAGQAGRIRHRPRRPLG